MNERLLADRVRQQLASIDGGGGAAARRRRVLLVEDDPAAAAAIQSCLAHDTSVTLRPTLERATRAVRRHTFDVALTDFSLPDAPAGQAVEVLARLWRFPVLLLADREAPGASEAAVLAGAQDFLLKPRLRRSHLERAVRAAIHRHEALVQYRRLLEYCPDAVLIVSQRGEIVFANPAATAAFARPLVGTMIGVPISGDEPTEISLVSGRVAEMRAVPVPWQGASAFLMMLRDVSDRVRAVAELEQITANLEVLTVLDPLTKVLNRRGTETALREVLAGARRAASPSAAVLIDCDDFKGINDSSGYAAGDATLQCVARALTESVRPGSDRVGRIGGDEFIVLLPHTTAEDACLVAERIRAAVHHTALPLFPEGARAHVTVSVGVAAIPTRVGSLNEVVALAQAPLMRSKRRGKNRISAEGLAPGGEGLDLEDLLRAPQTLGVAAHPIVRPADGAITGLELLIRGPVGGRFETPNAIFLAAKRRNVLAAIDLLCLRRCVEACRLLPAATTVNVNIYPSTLSDTPEHEILAILERAAPASLVLELNEQEFIGDPQLIVARAGALRRVGVRVALDDIGYGRSSFEALAALEPDLVKIDRGAVSGVHTSADKRRTLARMLTCVRSLGAEIVAEGVEHDEEVEVIVDLDVPLAQGFLWGRPYMVVEPADSVA